VTLNFAQQAAVRGQNIAATYLGGGAYSVSVTGPTQECVNLEAPIAVTPEGGDAPGQYIAASVSRATGTRPYANTWTVQLYDATAGALTPVGQPQIGAITLDVIVACQTS
jgi:hypothetical protein